MEKNQNICLLHCISIYPPETSTISLNNILGLREEFPDYPIGYSDHSLGNEIAIASPKASIVVVEVVGARFNGLASFRFEFSSNTIFLR